ncbi:MAG: hypothetical protein U9Q82_07965 [Chloroflexota bacterium]|nr:hypothetical protein [Chloroflexota bacterium]
MNTKIFLPLFLIIVFSVACIGINIQPTPTAVILGPTPSTDVKVVLQRLQVDFLGQDGHRVIGSGCPGNDGKGSIENYHFVVKGVSIDRSVQRVLVAGDNSTLTWEWPCNDSWGLFAQDLGHGTWDVFIAPSSPSKIYTLIFFYADNTIALGMVETP